MREKLFSVTKKDFRVDTFRAGGKGGQNQNKRDTGVRITHIDSGAVGEARDSRSQASNRESAFKRLLETPKWRMWFNLRVMGAMYQQEIERTVEEQMKHVKVEVKENGVWIEA